MSLEENKAVVRRFIHEGVIGGDLAVIDELCAPECVNHAAVPEARRGAEGVKRVVGFSRAAMPDQRRWTCIDAHRGATSSVHGILGSDHSVAESFRGVATPAQARRGRSSSTSARRPGQDRRALGGPRRPHRQRSSASSAARLRDATSPQGGTTNAERHVADAAPDKRPTEAQRTPDCWAPDGCDMLALLHVALTSLSCVARLFDQQHQRSLRGGGDGSPATGGGGSRAWRRRSSMLRRRLDGPRRRGRLDVWRGSAGRASAAARSTVAVVKVATAPSAACPSCGRRRARQGSGVQQPLRRRSDTRARPSRWASAARSSWPSPTARRRTTTSRRSRSTRTPAATRTARRHVQPAAQGHVQRPDRRPGTCVTN